jgi:hypothetical protein
MATDRPNPKRSLKEDCPLETALLSGQPHMNLRAFIIKKSGARIAVSMNAAPLKDEEGLIIGAVETFQDLLEVEELRRQVSHRYAPEDIVGRHSACGKSWRFGQTITAI